MLLLIILVLILLGGGVGYRSYYSSSNPNGGYGYMPGIGVLFLIVVVLYIVFHGRYSF